MLSTSATVILALGLVSAAAAQSTPTALAMPVPTPVKGATLVAHMPASTMLNMSISIAPNRSAMKAYADAVSNPNSPDYHRFLNPSQIGARFGAPVATLNSVVSYLKSKGLTVTQVGDTRMAILFKGKASVVESAFSTKINTYRATGRPDTFYSYATVPKLPASFASQIVSVGGLQTAYVRTPLTTFLTPSQSRGLYAASSLYATGNKGLGVTVGITNLGDGYRLSNLPLFYSTYGLPTPTGGIGSNVSSVPVAGIDGNTQPEGIESNLDIQMVLAEAPFAKVIVYDGFGSDLVSIVAREVQDNLIDIASESWVFSNSTDVLVAVNDQHLAMTLEGITYMAGTGDWGADESRGNYPHAYPDVLAIGGTDATVSDSNGTRVTELGWFYSGAGWEPSDLPFNHLPAYQVGSTVPTDLDKRLFPDFSLHAAGSMLVYGGNVGAVGGTSSSGPQFAGLLALILERLKTDGAADVIDGHYRLGRIHDLVYSLDGSDSVFYDVTQGDAENLLPDGTTPTSKVGWDYVTGWGAPISQGLYDALLSASSLDVIDGADSADIYQLAVPSLALGTSPEGDSSFLITADGVSYSVLSIKQAGVGQVAAVNVNIPLQTEKARRSASVTVAFSSPKLTTGFVYLFNKTTNVYDCLKTVAASGTTTSATFQLDVSSTGNYIQDDGTVKVLVRAMKPSRLGNAPFQLSLDQVVVTEKVARG